MSESEKPKKTPFKLPTDEEVFLTREAQQLKKQQEREQTKNLRIWEKHTVTTGRQLKRPKESETSVQSLP